MIIILSILFPSAFINYFGITEIPAPDRLIGPMEPGTKPVNTRFDWSKPFVGGDNFVISPPQTHWVQKFMLIQHEINME